MIFLCIKENFVIESSWVCFSKLFPEVGRGVVYHMIARDANAILLSQSTFLLSHGPYELLTSIFRLLWCRFSAFVSLLPMFLVIVFFQAAM